MRIADGFRRLASSPGKRHLRERHDGGGATERGHTRRNGRRADGELLLVTEDGVEGLHSYERGLRCSSAGGAPSQVLMPAPCNSVARRRIGPVLSASQQ
jgi:hypothetical protein